MKNEHNNSHIITRRGIIVIPLIIVLLLVGCSNSGNSNSYSTLESIETSVVPEHETEDNHEQDNTDDTTEESVESIDIDEVAKNEVETEEQKVEDLNETEETESISTEDDLSDEQLNSFSMMYYLAITADEILTSKNNRLMLDEIYDSLLNDINPGAIDEITQEHLRNLRDIIKAYNKITTKRERLQYVYNQQKAAAIRSAIPNPVSILNIVQSKNWKQLAISATYTVFDSVNNYINARQSADQEFLMNGWELDDEEIETVSKNRERAFDYMVDMVQQYDLDGMQTLNEKAIEQFSEICKIEAIPERIRRLRAEENTYQLLGNYWLELADCYFEISEYDSCLECVNTYDKLYTGIYRKDFNYAQILPKAIVAAQNIYEGEQYITVTGQYADALIQNTSTEDWSARFFAAQVYLDLYSVSNEKTYLESAYKVVFDNVTVLLNEQRLVNETYMNEVQKIVIEEPDYKYLNEKEKKEKEKEYKAEKKRAEESYNELKEIRKTELPPLYEPLIINCELLLLLAEEKGIDKREMEEIEAVLQSETNGIFMSQPINDALSFSDNSEYDGIEISRNILGLIDIVIPASLLSQQSRVIVTVSDNGNSQTFEDCEVKNVERKGETIDTFLAHFENKQLNSYQWTPESRITIEIIYDELSDTEITSNFKVSNYSKYLVVETVEFEKE